MHPTKPSNCIYVEKTSISVALVATSYKRVGEVPDGASTQMVAYMINKWKRSEERRVGKEC